MFGKVTEFYAPSRGKVQSGKQPVADLTETKNMCHRFSVPAFHLCDKTIQAQLEHHTDSFQAFAPQTDNQYELFARTPVIGACICRKFRVFQEKLQA
ncbi:hypothetical protein [Cohaesibacter sp. ES.047]|uniref:hypothetical protein n=1 Tax=Cohaesibacter sp. ES.047 TaxID=1798205 RepID=UPI0012FDF0CE|nr:hypothetical protein [Cohaesibacter sp. ES.047]